MYPLSENYVSQTEGAIWDPFVFNNPLRINQFSHINFISLKKKKRKKKKKRERGKKEKEKKKATINQLMNNVLLPVYVSF